MSEEKKEEINPEVKWYLDSAETAMNRYEEGYNETNPMPNPFFGPNDNLNLARDYLILADRFANGNKTASEKIFNDRIRLWNLTERMLQYNLGKMEEFRRNNGSH
jgi:hypothetical protein